MISIRFQYYPNDIKKYLLIREHKINEMIESSNFMKLFQMSGEI